MVQPWAGWYNKSGTFQATGELLRCEIEPNEDVIAIFGNQNDARYSRCVVVLILKLLRDATINGSMKPIWLYSCARSHDHLRVPCPFF
jgi:hypothetical protein